MKLSPGYLLSCIWHGKCNFLYFCLCFLSVFEYPLNKLIILFYVVKGVNFFGSNSEYVISGSDCGYIFFWDKESEHIVKYMYGDEMGVVSFYCLTLFSIVNCEVNIY